MKTLLFIVSSFFVYATHANSDADLKASAMKQTQDFLNDSGKIQKEVSKGGAAKAVDDHVMGVAGNSENSKEMYSISADILPFLMEMNQDNPEKAMESLSEYSKNPAKFLESLPSNIRERIENLAKKIESEKGKPTEKKP